MASGAPMISVKNLWKVFGANADKVVGSPLVNLSRSELRAQTGNTIAVRDVSFDVAPGEVFVVMGLSGSGKSTLVRCMTRLIEPTQGSMTFEGEDILKVDNARLRELRKTRFSMVFQHFGLLPHRNVIDNIAYSLEINGVNKADRHKRANEVIELVGLQGYSHAYPEQLSGRLHHELGKTMVFITHDLSEAVKVGDRIAIMRDGAIVQIGTPEDLVANPADEYVANFVRDIAKSHVLTLKHLARNAKPGEETDGPELSANTIIREAAQVILQAHKPVRVNDNGKALGIVSSEDVLRLISGGL
ncbi:MAG: ATP-binding cassette domain-containing protein [Actinobacteria bacterium]|nr:ATP-binding cassette domain-containing protein [Actinomycetota bacterium]